MIPFKKSLPVIFIILLLLLHNSALNSMASFNDPRYLQELATLKRIPLENISQHYPPEQVSYMTGLKYIQGLGIEKNIKEGFNFILQAAQQGLPAAQRAIGKAYYEGSVTPANHEEAFKWFKLAAQTVDAYALEELFVLPYSKTGKNDFNKIPEWKAFVEDKKNLEAIQSAAEKGNADAQFTLATIYSRGILLPEDGHKAIELLNKAVEKNHPSAQFMLAQYLKQGIFIEKTEKNELRAFELLKEAAHFKPSAQYELANMHMQPGKPYTNIPLGKSTLEKFCENGSAKACTTLGTFYITPPEDVEPDYDAAYKLFQKAYDLGDNLALYYLATLSSEGFGPDPDAAKKLYQKILSLQDPDLDVPKGMIYEFGLVGKKNIKKAKEYYSRAKTASFAQNRLQVIAQEELLAEESQQSSATAAKKKSKAKGKGKATTEPELPTSGESSSSQAPVEPEIDIAGHALKDSLNKAIAYHDKSVITDINTETNVITIYNPYDNSTVTITLKEPITKKNLANLKEYTYAPRVKAWFNPKGMQATQESIDRHRFAQRVDEIVQLYGPPAYFPNGTGMIKNTILKAAITLPDGTILSGDAEYTVNDKGELYHRFLHPRTRAVARNSK